jgi:hypothetical protein
VISSSLSHPDALTSLQSAGLSTPGCAVPGGRLVVHHQNWAQFMRCVGRHDRLRAGLPGVAFSSLAQPPPRRAGFVYRPGWGNKFTLLLGRCLI